MPPVSIVPEWYRRVQSIDQTVTGVPTGAPEPFWPDAGTNQLLCEWTGQEITRLLSALKIGADMVYPDISHTVVWSLLRQLEFPNELPEADTVEFFVADHFVSNGGAPGSLSAGNNLVDMFTRVTRDDIGISKIGDNGIYLPAGNWDISWWHSCRTTVSPRQLQGGLYRWAVPEPQIYYWGGPVQLYQTGNTLMLQGGANISIAATWPLQFVIWASGDINSDTAQGIPIAGRDGQFGRVVCCRVSGS